MPISSGVPLALVPIAIGGWTLLWVLATLVFVPGLLLAEEASSRLGHPAWIYAAVVLAGSAAVSVLTVPLGDALGLEAPFWVRPGSPVPRQLLAFLDVVMRVGLAAFIYASHRQGLAAARTLRELEARQTEMMAGLSESSFQTARARVRPEAFIEELRELHRTYLDDPESAESALETMITRLRVASRGFPA
ncbi:MAG TPA: hypothetical protein VFD38_13980 [Myxococcaceae bacterium]|nr:hypothetical protein [Myxococcaceae bacterium]